MMRLLPWKRTRAAEHAADGAEVKLRQAAREREVVKGLARESRALKQENGFAEAVRAAMGVSRP